MYLCSTFLSIFFLHHQGEIVYSVIGDLQTPFYFDVNSRSGIVTIKNSLVQDNAQTYIVCTTYLLDTCILVYHFTELQHFLGVWLQQNLHNMAMLLQLRVTAYDSLSTSRVATSTVSINVIKNPSGPIFTLPAYEVTIPETQSLGSTVVNVTATDQDGVRPLPW